MTAAILIVVAYLLGSLSAAIIVCRAIGAPDPRTVGSGNPGATNVLRVAGRKAAAATLLGDSLKGLLPVLLGRALGLPIDALAAIGFAAFLGHLYPVFFQFQGGKGVATLIGALLGIAWPLAVFFVAIWFVVARLSKLSSLAAITASVLTPLYAWFRGYPALTVLAVLAMVVLLLWRHRSNIRKLIDGTESRIGSKSSTDPPSE
ncbi:MAG: putative glycerol-3-phosphate acyltransferase [Gammaproteobacteria bacterium]|nr:putative glycerol-3-phosphate acyltransferase [Gammaproteobacteria bacterium]